jgi:hypothetical protein
MLRQEGSLALAHAPEASAAPEEPTSGRPRRPVGTIPGATAFTRTPSGPP